MSPYKILCEADNVALIGSLSILQSLPDFAYARWGLQEQMIECRSGEHTIEVQSPDSLQETVQGRLHVMPDVSGLTWARPLGCSVAAAEGRKPPQQSLQLDLFHLQEYVRMYKQPCKGCSPSETACAMSAVVQARLVL